MPKCTILVGVPGSGKSTWLIENRSKGAWIVSTDNIINGLADDYGFTYDQIFKETIRFADMAMVARMLIAAENGYDLYIDRTNMSEKSRQQFIKKLSKYGYEFECVVFPTPERDELDRRLSERSARLGKTIPQEVVDRMIASYEMPLYSEGFSKITYIA